MPGPVSQLASPVGMRLCLPAPLCHKVPTLAGQGVAAPTAPGLGEAWKWPGNWLWVDLIPSDFPFCELFPSLLTFFPLLNKCFQHGIWSSSPNRKRPASSSPSAPKALSLKSNRTQPPLGGDVNPVSQRPILSNKMELWDTSRAVNRCNHPG